MLTRGYVVDIDYERAKLQVRMPLLNSIGSDRNSTPDDQLTWASYLEIPGIVTRYEIGDVVMVGFENNELSVPFVLGHIKLSSESSRNTGSRVDAILNTLEVQSEARLSSKTAFKNDSGSEIMTFQELWDKIKGE